LSTKANTVFEQVKAAMESDPARSKSDVFKQIAEDTGRSLSAVRANF